jgi:copper chaperone NosL
MKLMSRILLAMAALMLIGMYVLPMWSISLDAPQYPEGLGLKIYINTVTGATENDLQNINGLNHYIGMKRIEPDAIPELKYMPPIIGAMIVLGLIVAWLGRCWMILAWSGLFTVLGIIGIVDFYLWEYDYGHNLDPHAAIVIPGMAYQPPLIGSKQLLNFTAHSYPDIAGYIVGVSIMLGFGAWWICLHGKNKQPKTSIQPKMSILGDVDSANIVGIPTILIASCLLASTMLVSCEPKPEAIDWGKEECSHCKMIIADKRFAAELLTTKGKVYKFDAIECMAEFVNETRVPTVNILSLWVTDFHNTDGWIEAKKSFFLQSDKLQSPMGLNIAAFPHQKDVSAALQQYGGKELYWDGVRLLVAKDMTK